MKCEMTQKYFSHNAIAAESVLGFLVLFCCQSKGIPNIYHAKLLFIDRICTFVLNVVRQPTSSGARHLIKLLT